MAYQYKKQRKAGKVKERAAISPEKPSRTEEVGPLEIHGRPADSKEEVMLARALDKLGIEYHYQVPIFGGKGVVGGMSVDFVCFVPQAVPVEVFGAYYHSQQGKNDLRMAMLFDYFKQPPVIFWDYEMETQAAVDALAKERLG